MTAPPWTIDTLRELRGEALITAANEYAEYIRETLLPDVLRLRDAEIAQLADEVGPAEAARRSGLSVSSVRVIRKVAHR